MCLFWESVLVLLGPSLGLTSIMCEAEVVVTFIILSITNTSVFGDIKCVNVKNYKIFDITSYKCREKKRQIVLIKSWCGHKHVAWNKHILKEKL